MNNKGMVIWEVLIWAIILVIVAVLLIYMFRGSLSEENKIITQQIDGSRDTDGDLVPNVFDKCPDKPTTERVAADGCTDAQRTAREQELKKAESAATPK
ncbi:MAG TPA: hypothetical protein VJH88_03590 [Candidatus Nanoarchaeia archaeon]|nr:hypothetical protein [Candidatus Nanoarchaeia archaeon]